jgi:hypothetical protein
LDSAFIARDEAVYNDGGTWETGNNTDCRTANMYLAVAEKKLRSMFKSTLGLHAAALHIRKVGQLLPFIHGGHAKKK